MKVSDFNYDLPKDLIAQRPIRQRSASRLMVLNGNKIIHKQFSDILNYLQKGDCLVINESKVIPAKLDAKKTTGGKLEVLLISEKNGIWKAMIKGRVKAESNIMLARGVIAEITEKKDDFYYLKFNKKITDAMLKKLGKPPLPNYIKNNRIPLSRYQTVYAKKRGSIAAPTAGLHFTKELLKKISQKGVKIARIVLHVSIGTFLPVRTETVEEHRMYPEYFEINRKTANMINSAKRLFVVGTTTMKTLESANKNGKIIPIKGKSDLFIYPGYCFKTRIEGLITNFHLPKSTLIMLVAAFAGSEKILHAYKTAVNKKYRFYSFGDAMLILK